MSEPAPPCPLSPRQQRFVDEYIIDLNATKAAIRAGYSAKTAKAQGARLLTNVDLAEAVAKRKAERSAAVGITEERVLRELEAMAFSDITHYQQNEDTGILELAPGAPPNAMAAVSSVKYRTRTIFEDGEKAGIERECEFKLWDKPGSVKLAGRYKAVSGFFDKLEVTGKNGQPLVPPETSDALAALLAVGIGQKPQEE